MKYRNPKNEQPMEGLEGFYDEFLQTRLEELGPLKQAIENQSESGIHQIVHKWKGYSAPYGFGELALLAQEMETAAQAASYSDCLRLYQTMCDYLESKRK